MHFAWPLFFFTLAGVGELPTLTYAKGLVFEQPMK